MKRLIFGCMVLIGMITVNAELPIRAERESAVYKVGEEIRFKVASVGEAFYTVNDGSCTTRKQKVTGDILVKAEKPGFILVHLTGRFKNGKVLDTLAGAAIEPEKITAGSPRPADFDQFWENELKKLRASKLEVVSKVRIPAEHVPAGVVVYDVLVRRGDVEVSGFVACPAGAKAKSVPGTLSFLGASKVSADLRSAVYGTRKYNAICFNVNFHGEKNYYAWDPVKKNFYGRDRKKEAPARRKVRNYQYLKANDREAYAMRKIFLRTVVAADYIMSMPEYNGILGVAGGSLGGCQSVVCAALIPEVKFCCATASAMSDHLGAKAGHCPGWPNMLQNKITPPGAEAVAPYFDVVNFASRIKCPVIMAVGFIDTTTPPASTYAAYNALTTSSKKMYHVITGGHGPRLDKKEKSVFAQGGDEFADFMKKSR